MTSIPGDVKTAKRVDPSGSACVWCSKDNDFADDLGWYYLFGKFPCCMACYFGKPGKAHISKYGMGER